MDSIYKASKTLIAKLDKDSTKVKCKKMFMVWTDAHILNDIPTNQTEEHSKDSMYITLSNYFYFRDLRVKQYIKMV